MAPLSPFDRDEYEAAHPVDHDRRACLRLAVWMAIVTAGVLLVAAVNLGWGS